ncbi:hypothetical protein GPECTOR_2g1002 [Gonium pectorale]|uniref:Transmembrane protein 135 N-terminal domain-containing protein n=1 Tax=Gonium pectorale TaxID=33097 RepID=A0A150H0D1_GONPE|nr:hypothetical protein GPECTOR_2g1002 [Gonium pectorale]|eukprot:KXZ55453.1 hypothetical protein GPECTOR_2g1002 [Gonium pectorale]
MYLLSRLRGKGRQRLLTLGDVLHDTCLHTCFLAMLGSSYTLTDEAIALVFGKERTQRWRALVAGLVAGQSLRITGPRQRHYSLATYILLRGLTLLVRTGNKPSAPPALRALLRPTRLAHGDTLLMCVAASQILYSFIMEPGSLPTSYVRFINRMGGKDPAVWAAMREHALRNTLGLPPGPLQSLARSHLAYLNARPGRLRTTPCEFFHPGQSCAAHALSVLPQAYGTALSVYVPFYAVSSVLVHRTALLAKPGELLPKMAVGVLRSSAFLSAYMAAAFAGACAGFSVSGVNTGPVIAATVWLGGLATLIEKKSRRMELAMYCAARALEAFIRCCWLWSSSASGPAGGHYHHHQHGTRPGGGPAAAALLAQGHARSRAPGGLPAVANAAALAARRAGAASGSAGGSLRLDVLLFSLGCGAIAHCYSDACGQHRDVFRSKYLNVLDFVFGNEGVQRGSISHVPTNRELVSTVGRRIRSMSIGVISHAHSGGAASATSGPGDYSPLPRSAAQSQSEGLYAMAPAFRPYGAGGGFGGGTGGFGGAGGSGFGAGGGAAGGGSHASSSSAFGHGQHGGQGYSRFVMQGTAAGQGGPQEAPYGSYSGRDSPGLPYGYGQPATAAGGIGHGATAGSSVAAMSADGSSASLPLSPVHGLKEPGGPAAEQAEDGLAGGAAATAQAAARRSCASSDASSGGDSGWEDVWASATGTAPNAAAAAAVDGSAAGRPTAAAAAQRACSDPVAGLGSGQAADSGAGAFGWAARLVAGALSGSRAGSSAGLAAAAAAAPAKPAEEDTLAAGVAGSAPDATRRGIAASAAGGRSLRRISTAPQALLLLSDPDSERCGRGRSSYQKLQQLSSDDDSSTHGAAGGSGGAELAAASKRAFAGGASSSRSAAPAPAAAAGRSGPVRAVPIAALPNASSRTPAFRSSHQAAQRGQGTIAAAATAGGTWPWQRVGGLAGRGGGSVPSGMDRMGSSSSLAAAVAADSAPQAASAASYSTPFSAGVAASAAGVIAAGPAAAAPAEPQSRLGGAVGVLTLAPRSGWSHTSPVQGAAAVWPQLSTDAGAVTQEEEAQAAAAARGADAESEAEEQLSRSAP